MDWSGNEDNVDIFMEESAVAGPSGTPHRYVHIQKANGSTDVTAVTRKYCRDTKYLVPNHYSLVCCPLRVNEDQSEATWMLDSGASCHFTNDINDFIEFEENVGPERMVQTANGSTSIAGKGTVIFIINGDRVRLYPVFYIPDLNDRLLSLGQFHQSGLSSRGSAHSITLYDGNDEEFLTFYPQSANSTIYVIQSLLGTEVDYSLSTVYNVDFEIMHRHLTHPSGEVLRKAGKYVKDFPDIKIPSEHFCPGCAQGKMTQKPFPASETRATEPFELIHSDLKMQPVESYRKYRYTITFLDDFTSHTWTINLRTKDAALPATHHFLVMVETQYKMSVRAWMSDAGGEYTSTAFTTMMKEKGITVLQSVPHAHQQNGRAERLNRTLSDKAESLRSQACLPPSWWEFALDHATHVYNWTSMKQLEWRTPSEWLTGTRPSIDHLQVLGCAAYVFIPAEVRTNKLSPKSKLMTYLGTAPGSKGWIFMHAPKNIVFTAVQTIFDESMFPKCPASKVQPSTRLQTPVPPPTVCPKGKRDCQGPPVGDDEPLPSKTSGQRSYTRQEKGKARDDGDLSMSSDPSTPSSTGAEPPTSVAPPPQPTRRSGCVCKVPKKEGNVYSDKHPVQIEKDIRQKKDWDWIVDEQSSRPHPNVPGPSTSAPVPSPPRQPQEGTSSGEEEKPDSKSEVEDSLEPSSDSEEVELVA